MVVNVYDAARHRVKYAFDNFDSVTLSFSGGKDSGVMLNIALDYLKENPEKRMGLFHLDYEAQYQHTTDYVTSVYDKASENKQIDSYWVCLPIAAQCATSMHQSDWIPWESSKRDIWVRKLPKASINESNHELDFFVEGMWDYEFQNKFSEWVMRKNNSSNHCSLVGIRTDESLNRWRAIHADSEQRKRFDDKIYTKEVSANNYNLYPIFEWKASDVWTANARYDWEYNELYDLYHQAGLTIDQMRVASPFNDCAIESLKLYRVIDPNNWAKMIGRVNGVNFSAIYGGTTAMGWRKILLPKGHTWKSYMEFLLSTLPTSVSDNYKKKLNKSIEFWAKKGGVLSPEVIQKLSDRGINFTIGEKTNYRTEKLPVTMDYLDDIDIDEFKDVPTYKRMCVCIMKNDHLCKYMGFSLNKTETQKRAEAENKYARL